ncbi:MAG: YbaK/EbsC family protein [SAR202 cluster bacterium]|nr:YbaK/EbsC family protein [SAR202 cluster bacterium]
MTQEADIVIAVESALKSMGVEYELFEIDAEFADTAAFCERYDFPLDSCGNTIVVASKRGAKKYSACIVKGTDRLDVNKRVKGLMEGSRVSFASADETAAVTGMMIGGVTPFALPADLPIYVDQKLLVLDSVILGSGSRSSKIRLDPREMQKVPNLEFIEGLSLPPRE